MCVVESDDRGEEKTKSPKIGRSGSLIKATRMSGLLLGAISVGRAT